MTAPPLLVVVTGQPGTGKTTLARRIAAELSLPLIYKDGIKESLFDSLGWSDRAWSNRLGRTSILLLFQLAGALLDAGVAAVIEANFTPELAKPDFEALRRAHPFRPFVVQVTAQPEVIVERYRQRNLSGERHRGHIESDDQAEIETRLRAAALTPLDLGGAYHLVDTTDFEQVDITGLIHEIRAAL